VGGVLGSFAVDIVVNEFSNLRGDRQYVARSSNPWKKQNKKVPMFGNQGVATANNLSVPAVIKPISYGFL
ncbi:MAG TPA: hypothetical protein PKE26_15320, partial [Kiritimatiellia bacterium]|nr:hypothetical protein [Kiritimatiellia bacterium]HMP00466.1 hypothetical protein [Kiritimatiellia bacterium]